MNRWLKRYLTLGVALAGLSSIVPAGAAAAGFAEPGLKITLRIYNHAEVDAQTLLRAEQVATRIYRKIGVEVVWLDQQESDLNLIIPARATAQTLGVGRSSLGLAPGTGRRDWAYVFYDRVEELSRSQVAAVADRKVRRWATTAQILGCAMAHEVGHLLGLSHSAIGLMRDGWRWNDLLNVAYGDLDFTPQQAAVIRTAVRMRQD